jgi:hypothetical protein
MSIGVRRRIWESWDENGEEVAIVLRCQLPLGAALVEFQRARQRAMAAGSLGWISDAAPTPAGAVVLIDGFDDLGPVMVTLTESLEAAGVEGVLDEFTGGDVPTVLDPFTSRSFDLVECRLSLNGHRVVSGEAWQVDRGALSAVLEYAVDWCLPAVATGTCHLAYDVGWFEIDREAVASLVRPDLLGPESMFGVGWEHGESFRLVYLRQGGHLSVIVGTRSRGFEWRDAVNGMHEVLRAAAPWAVYGFVKRGSSPKHAVAGRSLRRDWPDIPHVAVLPAERARHLEDRYVPDAFGLQLLGPGHADRLPEGGPWTITPMAGGVTVVEHHDRAAWYDDALPDPMALDRARHDLGPLLMRDAFFG